MRLGAYEVGELVGRGGAGAVFRGRAPGGGDVAIKLLVNARPDAIARFERERKILAELGEEDGFVPLLDAGASPQGPFIVMPFVPGGTLRGRLGAPMAIADGTALARALARALAAAHARGIVHRDLKPENVLFDAKGRALVADLGLAKHVEGMATASDPLSRTGELRGTFAYMAPEQARDAKSVTPAADVFSLGAIAYECLAGRPALAGQTALEMIDTADRGDIVPLRALRPDVPRWLAAIVARSLAADPARRFADAGGLLRALDVGPPRTQRLAISGFALALVLVAAWVAVPLVARARAASWVARADELWNHGVKPDNDAVLEAATRALELDPSCAAAWRRRGEAHLRKGDGARAIPDLERAVALEPLHAETWNSLGVARAMRGELDGALAALGKALELEPGVAATWASRARVRFARKDFVGALADVGRALALERDNLEAWLIRADVKHETKDLAGAEEDLTRAIALAPRIGMSWTKRAVVRANRERLDDAYADLLQATTLAPDSVVSWTNRAGVALRLGRFEDCRAAATRAIELDPKAVDVHGLRARARLELHDPLGAREDATAEIALQPGSPMGYGLRASANAVLEDFAAAVADATRALERSPDDVLQLTNRSEMRARQGDIEGALQDAQRALDLGVPPDDSARLEKRVQLYRRKLAGR